MPVRLRPEERDRAEIADQRCVRLAELLPPALALDQDGPDADDGRAGRAQQAERRCARAARGDDVVDKDDSLAGDEMEVALVEQQLLRRASCD